MASQALLGVDVGFSKAVKTTGLAWLVNSTIETAVVGSSWDDRRRALPKDIQFTIAALDAPIVPEHSYDAARGCERLFYRGAFWNRCRPGLSHHGRGLQLKDAGRQAANDFALVLTTGALTYGPCVIPNTPIIEAFPNTFLGVLLPEIAFADWDKKRRQKKSDWLYEQVSEAGIFQRLLANLDLDAPRITRKFENAVHHDERAALICLLTALFAEAGTAAVVGDPDGGWFWLPPISFWRPWGHAALEKALLHSPKNRFCLTRRWQFEPVEILRP